MTEHIQTRAKLQEIPRVSTFNELLDDCMISPEEKTLMQMHYLQNKDVRYIGDMLGYSEVTMKRWHHRILKKINKLLQKSDTFKTVHGYSVGGLLFYNKVKRKGSTMIFDRKDLIQELMWEYNCDHAEAESIVDSYLNKGKYYTLIEKLTKNLEKISAYKE